LKLSEVEKQLAQQGRGAGASQRTAVSGWLRPRHDLF